MNYTTTIDVCLENVSVQLDSLPPISTTQSIASVKTTRLAKTVTLISVQLAESVVLRATVMARATTTLVNVNASRRQTTLTGPGESSLAVHVKQSSVNSRAHCHLDWQRAKKMTRPRQYRVHVHRQVAALKMN